MTKKALVSGELVEFTAEGEWKGGNDPNVLKKLNRDSEFLFTQVGPSDGHPLEYVFREVVKANHGTVKVDEPFPDDAPADAEF